MSTYGDMPGEHKESFQEWIDDGVDLDHALWAPPLRSMKTGHRVSVSDSFKPIGTRHLNWRWWLAEYPMRILARYMGRVENQREQSGEEYIGTEIHRRIEQHYLDMDNNELGPE